MITAYLSLASNFFTFFLMRSSWVEQEDEDEFTAFERISSLILYALMVIFLMLYALFQVYLLIKFYDVLEKPEIK